MGSTFLSLIDKNVNQSFLVLYRYIHRIHKCRVFLPKKAVLFLSSIHSIPKKEKKKKEDVRQLSKLSPTQLRRLRTTTTTMEDVWRLSEARPAAAVLELLRVPRGLKEDTATTRTVLAVLQRPRFGKRKVKLLLTQPYHYFLPQILSTTTVLYARLCQKLFGPPLWHDRGCECQSPP